jgi:hypothetical protein
MEIEDFSEGPVGVAVAASAVVFSPQVRRVFRRGIVYGVAGVLTAGDAVTGFVRGVRRSTRGEGNGAGKLAEGEAAGSEETEGQAEPRRARSRAATRRAERGGRS